jgi:NitT/TauT family transport system permease protein
LSAGVVDIPSDNAAKSRNWGGTFKRIGAARPLSARVLLGAASISICIVLWQIASGQKLDLGFISFKNVPTPVEVAQSALILLHSPKLAAHLGYSLFRVFSGYGLAALFGIGLGLAIGRARIAEDMLMPPLELLRPIPAVAWIPLAILMFPSAEISMIFITFTGAIFPILLNTIHGVENIDGRLIASARSLGAGRAAILREVIIPGALPSIVTGLAIGMGTSWFCLISAEMISGQFGIGYYTWEAFTLQNYSDIVFGMALIGILGMASSVLVNVLGRLAMPWHVVKRGR